MTGLREPEESQCSGIHVFTTVFVHRETTLGPTFAMLISSKINICYAFGIRVSNFVEERQFRNLILITFQSWVQFLRGAFDIIPSPGPFPRLKWQRCPRVPGVHSNPAHAYPSTIRDYVGRISCADQLQKLQTRAARIITKADYSIRSRDTPEKLNWPTLHDRQSMQINIMMYKVY